MRIILLTTFITLRIYTNHPLIIIISLIICTLIVAIKSFIFTKIILFSYILILIVLGGLIILFIYIASIAPNEIVYTKNFKILLIITISLILLIIALNPNIHFNNNKAVEILIFIYNPRIILIAATYLFITLIAVVQVTKITEGPLRSNF